MKKQLISIILLLTASSFSCFAANETKLDAKTQQQVVEKVKEYCTLMKEFSGDVEKIDNMDKIYSICENSGISVINDLEQASTRDISNNSMQLQQYMMMITEKYEHEVQTSYSGFKYVKTVVQPSPLKDFDAVVYAFVNVKKAIKTKNVKSKMSQNILVNIATMKVSSTISEDFEDPQGIYMEALEKYNNEDYDAAIPLFDKVAQINRFSGRYRAMSMKGWAYLKQKKYEEAFQTLKIASEEDPLGGIILANEMYLVTNIPARYQNIQEGKKLLEKYGEIHDTQFPTMHLMAKKSLIDLYIGGILAMKTEEDVANVMKLMEELREDADADPFHKITGLCYSAQMTCFMAQDVEDLNKAEDYIALAEKIYNNSEIPEASRQRCKKVIVVSQFNLLRVLGDIDKGFQVLEANKDVPGVSAYTAQAYYNMKKYDKAYEYYQLAANEGDAFSSLIVGISKYPIDIIKEFDKFLMDYVPYIKIDKQWIDFIGYLFYESKQQKSFEEHFKWNTIASNKGEISAMYWESMLLFWGIGQKADRIKGLTILCEAANSGRRNQSQIFIEWSMLMANKVAQEKDDASFNCIKNLSNNGNYAADYMLYMYYDLIGDNEKSYEYLKRSSEGEFYDAMQLYSASLLNGTYGETDTLKAYEVYKKLAKYTNSNANGMLGGIETEYFHNYDLAYEHYKLAIDENDIQGFLGMGELFENGWGVKRNLKMAKECYETAVAAAERSNLSGVVPEIEKNVSRVDSLIALESGNSADNKMIQSLNDLTNQKLSADARIDKSQKLLKDIFATPKAVVKTLGSNGKTVVSTETAEDFLLRLSTLKTDKKLIEVSSKKDKNGKYTELTVKME